MKCLRCGKEVDESIDVCDECGFSIKEQKEFVKINIEEDIELPKEEKVKLIDNPILTLIFGFVCALMGGAFFFLRGIVIIFLLISIASFALAFIFSVKPTKVKLKPFREFGIVLGYVGLALTLMKLIYSLINLIF